MIVPLAGSRSGGKHETGARVSAGETQPVFWGNLAMPRWATTLELLREPGPAGEPVLVSGFEL
jgi:hypothetical protein